MKVSSVSVWLLSFAMFSAACATSSTEEGAESEDSELGEAFRSPLDDRGALPLEAKAIRYPDDPRPFENALFGLSQTPGESRYVAYRFDARQGDGLLLAASKTSTTTTNGECDEALRIWLLDSKKRVVRAGTQKCEGEYEVPGIQTKSAILRHYLEESGNYTLVVAVLPSRTAPESAPIRTQPWKWVGVEVIRSHEEHQGGLQSRCQDGVDVLCSAALRCERARCK